MMQTMHREGLSRDDDAVPSKTGDNDSHIAGKDGDSHKADDAGKDGFSNNADDAVEDGDSHIADDTGKDRNSHDAGDAGKYAIVVVQKLY
ncbi:hypothetical protein TIFTF001_007211 [Ficus carica]|uniref:Uncharacterized protein n=1 Tax=Ficus carica TaxID=3494 RepID=A0AA87ZKQ9_FICCA|nr:hypothetical protein TIFTF001_007211 [Ficus carica]